MPDLMETHIENRWMVQPNHANTLDTAHGGNVLKWMDEVGAMSAMRFAGEICVTAHVNEVNFRRPIPLGDVALVQGYVYGAGRTSVRVRTRVFREDPREGRRELTTESYMVFVAIDEHRDPTPVPDLTVSSDRGEELLAEALADEPPEPGS
ncbi:MAG: acyl-CoA thioesterase [Haloferacaceae archaeon]